VIAKRRADYNQEFYKASQNSIERSRSEDACAQTAGFCPVLAIVIVIVIVMLLGRCCRMR